VNIRYISNAGNTKAFYIVPPWLPWAMIVDRWVTNHIRPRSRLQGGPKRFCFSYDV